MRLRFIAPFATLVLLAAWPAEAMREETIVKDERQFALFGPGLPVLRDNRREIVLEVIRQLLSVPNTLHCNWAIPELILRSATLPLLHRLDYTNSLARPCPGR